ncbi:MAG: T9SS type A sorting domain-containing protein [Chitinophagales bacterium]
MKLKTIRIYSIIYLAVFMLFTGTLFAQNALNISGEFEGTRAQFDYSGKRITKEFTYNYTLKQKGNVVEGISTIISEEGNYAEVGIRGVVIKDKFYFEEYKMLDQIKAPSMAWCYKSGVLNISTQENEIKLSGATPSYMVNYGYACTGGFTEMSAFYNQEPISKKSAIRAEENIELNLFPVPAKDYTSLRFNVKQNEKVSIEILDLSGKVVSPSETKEILNGKFYERFDVSNFTPGLYIFNVKIGDKIFTKEFLKYN